MGILVCFCPELFYVKLLVSYVTQDLRNTVT